jgi:hypothetical protein
MELKTQGSFSFVKVCDSRKASGPTAPYYAWRSPSRYSSRVCEMYSNGFDIAVSPSALHLHRLRIGELDHAFGFRIGREHADHCALLQEHQGELAYAINLEPAVAAARKSSGNSRRARSTSGLQRDPHPSTVVTSSAGSLGCAIWWNRSSMSSSDSINGRRFALLYWLMKIEYRMVNSQALQFVPGVKFSKERCVNIKKRGLRSTVPIPMLSLPVEN